MDINQETAYRILNEENFLQQVLSGQASVSNLDFNLLHNMFDDISQDFQLGSPNDFCEIMEIMMDNIEVNFSLTSS
jgi:hypothetical protein